jgi:hypothetical protein
MNSPNIIDSIVLTTGAALAWEEACNKAVDALPSTEEAYALPDGRAAVVLPLRRTRAGAGASARPLGRGKLNGSRFHRRHDAKSNRPEAWRYELPVIVQRDNPLALEKSRSVRVPWRPTSLR